MFKTDHLHMPEDHMDELYSSKNHLVRLVHSGRLDAITKEIPSDGPLAILDAGCGEGHLIERMQKSLPQHHYQGMDVTPVAIERAAQRCPFAKFRQANFLSTGYPDHSFDVVVCTETIEHVYEYESALQEFKRILKPGGYLILTFPNEILWTLSRFLLGRRPVKVPDHVNSFTPSRINRLVNLRLIKQANLPFGLPFAFSLNGLLKFQKMTP